MKKAILLLVWFPSVLFTIFLSLFYLRISAHSDNQFVAQLHLQTEALAKTTSQLSIPSVLGASRTALASEDARPALIERFFKKYNSPITNQAQYMVDIADKYGLDYALIPAMAMQESEACKKIPQNSNNCWGYGIYGDKVVRFESYEKAIDTVAGTLKEKYLEDSLTNPDLIMSRWTPSSNGSWAYAVNYFMQEIKQAK